MKAAEKINVRSADRKRYLRSALILLAAGIFILLSPNYYGRRIGNDEYRSWMMYKREPSIGIIKIWHIAELKPYSGSISAWLKKEADRFASSYIGIHFEVSSFTLEEAEHEIDRGNYPDVISYKSGTVKNDKLRCIGAADGNISPSGCLGEKVYALPYYASGRILLYDPLKFIDKNGEEMIDHAGDLNDFKNGKADSCVTDIRGYGDMSRALLMGKCCNFEALPIDAGKKLVQFIGIYKTTDDAKLPYALEYLNWITGNNAQMRLCGLGILPVSNIDNAQFDQPIIADLLSIFDTESIEPAFQ